MSDSSHPSANNGAETAEKSHVDFARAGSQVSAPTSPTAQTAAVVRKTAKRDYAGQKETMNGPLYMQASNNVAIVRRVKRKGESPWKQLARWCVENQIGKSPISYHDQVTVS